MIASYFLDKNITEDKKILTEEVQVEGADFLGSANGYDMFKLNTWQSAIGFTCEDTPQTVGACWTYDENTFNRNITGDVKFFIATREGTNNAVLAALSGIAGHEITELRIHPFNTKIILRNFWVEAFNSASAQLVQAIPEQFDSIVPFYLLPNFDYEGTNGMCIEDGVIVGSYAGLEETIPETVTVPVEVMKIKANAFAKYPARTLIIGDNVTTMEPGALSGFEGEVNVSFASLEEAGWPENWTDHPENVVWAANLTPEERERRQAEIAERQRQAEEERARQEAERARQEAEREAQRQEMAARQHQAMVDGLRFKEEGDHIVILGGKRSIKEFDIPETLNNKPVTKIAPFAFFDNSEVTKIVLPNTIKEIGKAAFQGCTHLWLTRPKDAIVYRDALSGVSRIDIR